MSERFEQSIRDWYQNSRIVDLEYLNLETKEDLKGLSHNLSVVHNKLLLHSKISIAEYKNLVELHKQNHQELVQILTVQQQLKQAVLQLQKEILSEPVFKYPKQVEEILYRVTRLEGVVEEIKRKVS